MSIQSALKNIICLSLALTAFVSWAQSDNNDLSTSDAPDTHSTSVSTPADETPPELGPAPKKSRIRQFHEVLDELLAEFGYDIKTGQLGKLKNLSVRRVEVSSSLPESYRSYVKTLVVERMRDNSSLQIIHCMPCESRVSKLVEGKLMITSPASDLAELRAAAQQLGISHFMDIVLVYHSTHMVLALQIFDSGSNELVWSRTYNSETIRSRFQKLAIDYNQVKKSRVSDEYVPDYKFLVGLGGAYLPNLDSQYTSDHNAMLLFQVRATERFDNRRSEFGLMTSVLATVQSLRKDVPVEGTSASGTAESVTTQRPKPYSMALGLHGVYSRAFLGSVEFYDRLRQGVELAAGGLLAPGYVAVSFKGGWSLYFGRRFALSLSGHLIGPATVENGDQSFNIPGGIGVEALLSVNL